MEAKKCDDCGVFYESSLRSAYYLIRDKIGSSYSLQGKLDLCDKCWNKMLKVVCKDLKMREEVQTLKEIESN